jgi:hypothetical protein
MAGRSICICIYIHEYGLDRHRSICIVRWAAGRRDRRNIFAKAPGFQSDHAVQAGRAVALLKSAINYAELGRHDDYRR